MCYLRHNFRIFLFCSKVNIMMSIRTWDRMHFVIYFLNHNSLSCEIWPTDRYTFEQYFSVIFWTAWRTGAKFQVLFNLATCSNYSIISYVRPTLKNCLFPVTCIAKKVTWAAGKTFFTLFKLYFFLFQMLPSPWLHRKS